MNVGANGTNLYTIAPYYLKELSDHSVREYMLSVSRPTDFHVIPFILNSYDEDIFYSYLQLPQ